MKMPLCTLAFASLFAAAVACDPSSPDDPASPAAAAVDPSPEASQDPTTTGVEATVGPAGIYAIEPLSTDLEPAGCRLGDAPPWTWELDDPEQATWTLVERVELDDGPREQPYACTSNGLDFHCTLETGFDYGAVGQDANVTLTVSYDATWEEHQSLAADYELSFTCQGSQCDTVASQWTVQGFPCHQVGSIRGVLQ